MWYFTVFDLPALVEKEVSIVAAEEEEERENTVTIGTDRKEFLAL